MNNTASPPNHQSFQPSLSVLTSVYRGTVYLPGYLSSLSAQTFFPHLEVIFILNQPDSEELALVSEFRDRFPSQVQIIEVPQVENIGASWNRALDIARGEYLAIWNVDDTREPESFALQVEALNAQPERSVVYGDYIVVPSFGSRQGKRWHTPPFTRTYFARGIPQGGAFLVWRRSMQDDVGGFDEQLQAAPDLDFSVRAVLNGHTMTRVRGILGYFLDEGTGLSTRDGSRRTYIEATLLQLRYGGFDKIRSQYLSDLHVYRTDELLIAGQWHPLSSLHPWYDPLIASRQYRRKLRPVRMFVTSLLRKLRLYDLLNNLRERFFRVDI